jgi:DNA-binding transcriptional ArsR family regulator
MMQRLSNEMRGGQRSLKSTGSRSFELWFRRDRAAFRPVRSRLPVGIAPNNLSFHLDRLRHAGLITVVRKGRWKIYSARGEIMKNLLNYLTDDYSPRKRVLGEINDVEMWGVDRLPLWSVARTRDSLAGVRILTMRTLFQTIRLFPLARSCHWGCQHVMPAQRITMATVPIVHHTTPSGAPNGV